MKQKIQIIKKQNIMKKYMIVAAAAALCLASCAKFETYTVSENDGNIPIGFTNYAPKSLTKADSDNYTADGSVLISGATFGVYAWSTTNGTSMTATPGAPNFMNGTVVTYLGDTTDGDGNTYSPLRFWPSGDAPDYLTFFAYYPQNAGTITPTINGSSNIGTFAFTAENAAADQVDFLVADIVKDQTYDHTNCSPDYPGTVKFTFRHQLTRVQFAFKKATSLGTTTVIELLDAELAGIKNSGTLTTTYVPATPATNTSWGSQSGSQGYEVFVNGVNPEFTAPSTVSNPVTLGESASTIAPADVFLMVPQDMAASTQVLNITWRVRVYDTAAHATSNAGTTAGGLLSETINSKSLSFYSDLVTSDTNNTSVSAINWVKNNSITYTITIGPKPIYFTAEVAPWATPAQTGYINVQ